VVAHNETLLVSDHAVCGVKVGFAEIFLLPQPPLLTGEGNVPLKPILLKQILRRLLNHIP
jgi:hypothetical protein